MSVTRRRGGQPVLHQIEQQCRATLTLLPFVAALPFVDEEIIVKAFGQAMAMLNWLPSAPVVPEVPELSSQPKRERTQEEQRTYWRETQREYRRRKREEFKFLYLETTI